MPDPASSAAAALPEAKLRHLRPFLASSRVKLFALGALGAVSGVTEAVVLVVVIRTALSLTEEGEGVTFGLAGGEVELSVGTALVLAAVGGLLIVAVTAAAAWVTATVAAEVIASVRRATIRDYLAADWPLVAEGRGGELQQMLTAEVMRVGQASLFFSQGLVAGLNFLALVVAALLVQALTATAVVLAAGVLFFALRPVSRFAKTQARVGVRANVGYAAAIAETVKLSEEYYTFGVSAQVEEHVDHLVDEAIEPYRKGRFMARLLPGLYQGAAILLVTGGLAVMVGTGVSDLAAVGTVVVLMLRATSYSQATQGSYHNLTETLPQVELFRQHEQRFERGRRRPGAEPLEQVHDLELDDVGFAYEPGRPVLTGVSLRLTRGETLGVIGASGAGKSTLMRILLRMRHPTAGRYLVNGQPVEDLSWDDWTRRVAVVPQSPKLLVGTVAENIRFFRDDLTDADIERAARMAQVHEEILAFTDGYDTDVGPRADNVSGGQSQRICIARALAGRPDLLVLDEPTSALDLRSEARFRDALRAMSGELTLVLVTHRHSTLELCDRVLVLQDGEVEALRPLAELDEHSPFFQDSLLAVEAG